MPQAATKTGSPTFQPRFRIFYRDEVALGPGKVELLRAIRETGSIRQAALQIEMSYMRAWLLIRTMNRCFKEPIVSATRGGRGRGARLTPMGNLALDLYERLQAQSMAATQKTRRQVEALLKPLSSAS